jgi:hypothetical protein
LRALEGRAIRNFAGCAWARLDETSRIDYLTDTARRELVRSLCRELIDRPGADWAGVIEMFNASAAGS